LWQGRAAALPWNLGGAAAPPYQIFLTLRRLGHRFPNGLLEFLHALVKRGGWRSGKSPQVSMRIRSIKRRSNLIAFNIVDTSH
jgi:hypothetical protein